MKTIRYSVKAPGDRGEITGSVTVEDEALAHEIVGAIELDIWSNTTLKMEVEVGAS